MIIRERLWIATVWVVRRVSMVIALAMVVVLVHPFGSAAAVLLLALLVFWPAGWVR